MKQKMRVSVNVSVSERACLDKDSSIEARDQRVASHFDGFFVVSPCVCQAFVHSTLLLPFFELPVKQMTMDDVPRHQSKVTLLRFWISIERALAEMKLRLLDLLWC